MYQASNFEDIFIIFICQGEETVGFSSLMNAIVEGSKLSG